MLVCFRLIHRTSLVVCNLNSQFGSHGIYRAKIKAGVIGCYRKTLFGFLTYQTFLEGIGGKFNCRNLQMVHYDT